MYYQPNLSIIYFICIVKLLIFNVSKDTMNTIFPDKFCSRNSEILIFLFKWLKSSVSVAYYRGMKNKQAKKTQQT